MFLTQQDFDKNMIYMIRHLTKNFIEQNIERSINGLPINITAVVEAELDVKDM